MTPEELAQRLRRDHGIPEGTIYDPHLHEDVPALCFGPLPEDNGMGGEGQHLRPELDLS